MELDWYCTDMLEMRHQCWWGLLWIFKRLLVSPLGRQRSPHQNVWFLIVNIQANRVAIVSSVITHILTLASIGPSQFNLFWMTLFSSVLVLFFASFYCTTFVWFSAFCVWFSAFWWLSAFVRFGSFVQYSNDSVYFLYDTGNVVQILRSRYTTSNKQSINIIQKIVLSFVLV